MRVGSDIEAQQVDARQPERVASCRATARLRLSHDMPGNFRSRATRLRIFGNARPNAAMRSYLLASRVSHQRRSGIACGRARHGRLPADDRRRNTLVSHRRRGAGPEHCLRGTSFQCPVLPKACRRRRARSSSRLLTEAACTVRQSVAGRKPQPVPERPALGRVHRGVAIDPWFRRHLILHCELKD